MLERWIPFRRKMRVLGVAEGRQYDLPLHNSAGNGFLILLIALMTFLAALALSASFALGEMTYRWSSGLENQMTIEISSEGKSKNEIKKINDKVKAKFEDYPNIIAFDILDDKAVQDLVSPWLGEDFAVDDLPLPGLVSLTVEENNDVFIRKLEQDLQTIDPGITIDTHEDWLNDLLGLIGSLSFLTFFVTLIIAFTGVTAIIGAIRSRMAEHKPDVELLHLMGASDLYISRQFQRHALILGLKGGLCGLGLSGFMLFLFSLGGGSAENALVPDFALNGLQIFVLLSLPGLACVLSGAAARFTVLRELSRMP